MARGISKILFIMQWFNFLAYLECVRSYAWSKGHSDPDLSSVARLAPSVTLIGKIVKTQGRMFLTKPI